MECGLAVTNRLGQSPHPQHAQQTMMVERESMHMQLVVNTLAIQTIDWIVRQDGDHLSKMDSHRLAVTMDIPLWDAQGGPCGVTLSTHGIMMQMTMYAKLAL